MPTGIIILAHGSRGERGKGQVEEVLQRISSGLKQLLSPDSEIIGAAMQFNHPDLEEAVALLSRKGVSRIIVAPYFLFAGRHITEDVPEFIEKLQQAYPEIQFTLANNLGLDESFISLMAQRIKEAAPELAANTANIPPAEIEQESMKIISGLLPPLPNVSEGELAVVKRIVHTCGDPEIAHLIKFSPSAIDDGVSAITRGSLIVTDVRMALAGIDKRIAEAFGCCSLCALDEKNDAGATTASNQTRTAAAIYHLGARLNGAVAAIGNAPTALFALLDLIDNQNIRPSLVVGMPVGFVQAEESKEALMKRDISYITIAGTRGGSTIAAATVNALLRLARDKTTGHKG